MALAARQLSCSATVQVLRLRVSSSLPKRRSLLAKSLFRKDLQRQVARLAGCRFSFGFRRASLQRGKSLEA